MKDKEQEQKMLEAYRKLSASGQVEVMSHTKTILKAENGIKKEYGLDNGKKTPAKTKPKAKRKSA